MPDGKRPLPCTAARAGKPCRLSAVDGCGVSGCLSAGRRANKAFPAARKKAVKPGEPTNIIRVSTVQTLSRFPATGGWPLILAGRTSRTYRGLLHDGYRKV